MVSIWVALSRSADVEVRIWAGTQFANGVGTVVSGRSPLVTGHGFTLPFGENLHAAVVEVKLTAPLTAGEQFNPDISVGLAPGSFHSYDLIIDGQISLDSEGLLVDETSSHRLAGVSDLAPLHLALGYDPHCPGQEPVAGCTVPHRG